MFMTQKAVLSLHLIAMQSIFVMLVSCCEAMLKKNRLSVHMITSPARQPLFSQNIEARILLVRPRPLLVCFSFAGTSIPQVF